MTPTLRLFPWFTLTLALATGCDGDTGKPSDSGDTGTVPPGPSARIATWNVGLAPNFVVYAEQRVQPAIDALNAGDADLVCLQEVWQQEDIDAIITGVAATYPYSYVDVTIEEGSDIPACSVEETTGLAECSREFCAGTEDLTGCVVANCWDDYTSMSPACQECAAANIGLNDVDAILGACLTGSSSYAWGGHNGLMLLSKEEMTDTDRTDFAAWLIWRSALYATVGHLHVTCTHLTADLTTPAYAGPDESYAAEQANQIDELIEWSSGKAAGGVEVLIGDMNTGPALGADISAELPDNYATFVAAGYADGNVDSLAPFCTWCTENTIVDDLDSSRAIDHILVLGAESSDPARLFDGTVDVTTDSGTVTTSLSDHFGWGVTLSWEEAR